MAGSSAGLHEERELLSGSTIDRHRAIVSLMEELEAVDWYAQRVDASSDPELKAILQHNLEEEQEHAVMVLEWLRRRDRHLDEMLRSYLFTEGEIAGHEQEEGGGGEGGAVAEGSLGIGSLKAGSAR